VERLKTYHEKARHCREAAKQPISLDLKTCFLELARTWEMLAEYRAFHLGVVMPMTRQGDCVHNRTGSQQRSTMPISAMYFST
jgi:hypothetical protein